MAIKTIKLFWWSETRLMGKEKENYGDLVGKYIVEAISGKKAKFTRPYKQKWLHQINSSVIYVTAGSILAHVNKYCVVWGSGIIQKKQKVKPAQFLAVRGPRTRQNLIKQGYTVPKVYGDPAMLLPRYFQPKFDKKYCYGVVPHYSDFKKVSENFPMGASSKLIDLMTTDIEATTAEILECEHIISSSLHGLIVAHAYGIPAIWVKFSDQLFGDDVKFYDYFESVKLFNVKPITGLDLNNIKAVQDAFQNSSTLPNPEDVDLCCEDLMKVCPF